MNPIPFVASFVLAIVAMVAGLFGPPATAAPPDARVAALDLVTPDAALVAPALETLAIRASNDASLPVVDVRHSSGVCGAGREGVVAQAGRVLACEPTNALLEPWRWDAWCDPSRLFDVLDASPTGAERYVNATGPS